MTYSTWLKIAVPVLLGAGLAMTLLLLPAGAVGGTDIKLAGSDGGGAPDIGAGSDGAFVAVAYYKQAANNAGSVYLKSGSVVSGWLRAKFLAAGDNPRLAFDPTAAGQNVVYVVWAGRNTSGTRNAAIKYVRCTLSVLTVPTCSTGDVRVQTVNADLSLPDVVVDGGGGVHVAWRNNGVIETALSTNNGTSWSAPVQVPKGGGDADSNPVLAWSNNVVHLAFLRGGSADPPTAVEYRQSADTSHTWTGAHTFFLGGNIIGDPYDRLGYPTLAARNNAVYLAWDAHFEGSDNYALMGSISTDNGTNWPGPRYIPSNQPASISPAGETKLSLRPGAGIPPQQEGLRPSVTVSPTQFALVWQQRPDTFCGIENDPENSSSEIYFAYTTTTWLVDRLANDQVEYAIDSDVAVGPGGINHFVFMKDPDPDGDCTPGGTSAFALYYRGPIINQTLDDGEEDDGGAGGGGGNGGGDGGPIFLPIVTKSG